jgi:hypothetical protein
MLCVSLFVVTAIGLSASIAKADDFGSVVKTIEQFYRVKHKGIPFMARAGMKVATTAARIAGGDYKRLAEAGSVKVAYFEDQQFDSNGKIAAFRNSLRATLAERWMPFIQVLEPGNEEQTHIFIREAGDKFNVLVVTLSQHDGVVVQVTLSPRNLALLMHDPEGMGKAITDDATLNDQE